MLHVMLVMCLSVKVLPQIENAVNLLECVYAEHSGSIAKADDDETAVDEDNIGIGIVGSSITQAIAKDLKVEQVEYVLPPLHTNND